MVYNTTEWNQSRHFLSSTTFFFGNGAVYEGMWIIIVEPDSPQMAI
jgi:hypothetical protein